MPEVAKKHGVNAQTIYAWWKYFGSLEPTDVKRLRQLEQENSRLKKLVADGTARIESGGSHVEPFDSRRSSGDAAPSLSQRAHFLLWAACSDSCGRSRCQNYAMRFGLCAPLR